MPSSVKVWRASLCLVLAFCAMAGLRARAADAVLVTVVNTTGQAVSDLHVTFTGTGGTIYVDPNTVVAGNCPVPAVPSNPPAVTNTATIDWGAACVQPGAAVAFLATTSNGPLAFNSGYWTLNGVRVGNITNASITVTRVRTPFGVPGFGTSSARFGAYKVLVRYRPCGPGIYTPWWTPNFRCWFRFCCFPAGFICEYRVVYCPFTSPWSRFWEFSPWFPMTGWIGGGKTGPVYFWQRLTYEPKEVHAVAVNPVGPTPDLPKDSVFESVFTMWNTQSVAYSDNNGLNFRPASDFTSAFLAMGNALALTFDEIEEPQGFEWTLLNLAPRYQAASQTLDGLISEIDYTIEIDGDAGHTATLQAAREHLDTLRQSLSEIGAQFSEQAVSDPSSFSNAHQALIKLADTVESVDANPRFANAADTLRAIAVGMEVAVTYIEEGLDTSVNQDYFLWGLINRFQPALGQFSLAMNPHARVQVKFTDYEWCRSTGYGVQYKIKDRTSGSVIEEGTSRVSDLDVFDIPIHRNGERLEVWFKAPTHLANSVAVMAHDGMVINGGEMIPGDVDGDNCITEADLELVYEALGTAGPSAEVVTSADVNFDGSIDDIDVALVEANLGACGADLNSDSSSLLPDAATIQRK